MRTIHCPQCRVRLEIPDAAGGKAARCPACKIKFRVPDPGEMLDESVVCWLDLDRLHADEDRDETLDATRVHAALSAEQTSAGRAVDQSAGDSASAEQAGQSGTYGLADPSSDPAPAPAPDQPVEDKLSLDEAMAEPQPSAGGHGSFVAVDIDEVMPRPSAEPSTPPAPANREPADPSRAHLQVVDVGAFGVRLRFHVGMFDLPGFRASMPMKCIAAGPSDHLVARPLPWIDKATGHFTNPGELEARYELNVRPHQSPREVLSLMATLDELPTPFNQPIPYYVSRQKAKDVSLHCETFGTREGVQCEVTIPSGAYALEWLGRVNGVCGEDYAQLEAEVLKFDAKAWRTIPPQVRHRLNVWFDFQAGEQFLGYFNDSDFAKNEAGLAGVVMTDRRVVYCKYHHHGQFNLDEDVLIAAIVDGQFVDLKAKHAGGTRRLVRLRRGDAITLANMLRKLDAGTTMGFYQPKANPDDADEKSDEDESAGPQNAQP